MFHPTLYFLLGKSEEERKILLRESKKEDFIVRLISGAPGSYKR